MRKFIVMAALMVGLAVGWWAVEAQTNPFYIAQSAQGIHITAGTLFPSDATTGQNPADGAVHIQLFAGATANPVMWIYSVDATAWLPASPIGTGVAQVPSTLVTNAVDVANSVWAGTGELIFEGATVDAIENEIRTAEPTVGVATFLLPDQAAAADIYPIAFSLLATNAFDAAGSLWFDTDMLVAEGGTANGFETSLTFSDVGQDMALTIDDYGVAAASFVPVLNATNVPEAANSLWVDQARGIVYEGAGVDAFEVVVAAADPTVGVHTYAFPDRAVAAATYEMHATAVAETATRDFMWPTEAPEVASLFMTADVNDDLYCHRIYLPFPMTVSGFSMWLEDGGGLAAGDILGASVYQDTDVAASQILAGTGDGTAAGLETVAMAGILQPDFYRFCACTSDQTNMLFGAVAIHDADYEALNAAGILNFGIAAQTCTAGVTPTFTGAIAADDEEPFMFKIH